MSSPRILFANTTNSPRSTPRPLSKFHVKKSHPTCIISLANVTANTRPVTRSSASRVPFMPLLPVTNLIPFPCLSDDYTDATIIHPDTSSGIRLLPSSPYSEPESFPSEPMTALPMTPGGRKRSTTRLIRPLSLHPTQDSTSDALQQPPRKRPRLQKGVKGKGTHKSSAKRIPSVPTSDLRFMASVQRSIAYGVRGKQQRQVSPPSTEGDTDTFVALDILLVGRLRTLLLSHGLKPVDLIDLNGDDEMDVDLNISMDVPVSTDMDIDLETTPDSCLPRSSPPPSPPSTLGPTPAPSLLSPSQLVASLIIRHHTQRNKPSRSPTSSEREGGISRGKPRRSSPLAHSIEVESDP